MPEIQSNQVSAENSPSQPDKPTEVTQNSAEAKPTATASDSPKTPCQGFQVDPLTKLHLCQTCPYHQYRNETKP